MNDELVLTGEHSNVRLQKLNWVKRRWAEGDTFVLPDRHRRLSNEAMNDAVGARQLDTLWKRITSAEEFERLMLTFMFHRRGFGDGISGVAEIRRKLSDSLEVQWRQSSLDFPNASTTDKALLLLGLRPYEDFLLAKGLHELTQPEREQREFAYWNYIAIYMGDFLVVRFVEHLLRDHPQLGISQAMYESDFEYSDEYPNLFAYQRDNVRFMWEIDLAQRLDFLRIQSPPTVGLRSEHMFTMTLQQKIVPALIAFAEERLASAESAERTK